MTRPEVESLVYELIVKQFVVPLESLSERTDLRRDLGADSMALVELMVSLEEAFDREMDAAIDMELSTLGDVVHYICIKLAAEAEAAAGAPAPPPS